MKKDLIIILIPYTDNLRKSGYYILKLYPLAYQKIILDKLPKGQLLSREIAYTIEGIFLPGSRQTFLFRLQISDLSI